MSMDYENEPKEHSTEGQAEHHTPNEPEEFSFLQEKIKEKPINRKALAMKIGRMAGMGLIFGLAASLGFFALKPWAEAKFTQNRKQVTIPKDDEVKEEEEPEVPEEIAAPILTIDNYKELNQACYQIATEADRSVVEVIGVLPNEEWIEKRFDRVNSVSGLIVADNGQELLILIKSNILREAEAVKVRFNDGYECGASLKKRDETLGIAIISVARADIREGTLNAMKTATLGNSNILRKGEPVIALGSPFSYAGGISYGIVSSTKNEIILSDGKYGLVCTDIPITKNGTGVFVNLNGEVIGFIDQTLVSEEESGVSTGLAISMIKKEIEMLSNAAGVPYIGILGNEVTKEISDAQGMPGGVYVKEIEADSPAMTAGIQAGDIITHISGDRVATLYGYSTQLLALKQGDSIKVTGQRRGANGYVEIQYEVTIGSKE